MAEVKRHSVADIETNFPPFPLNNDLGVGWSEGGRGVNFLINVHFPKFAYLPVGVCGCVWVGVCVCVCGCVCV